MEQAIMSEKMANKVLVLLVVGLILAFFLGMFIGIGIRNNSIMPPAPAMEHVCQETCAPKAVAAVAYTPATKTWSCACYNSDDTNILRIQAAK